MDNTPQNENIYNPTPNPAATPVQQPAEVPPVYQPAFSQPQPTPPGNTTLPSYTNPGYAPQYHYGVQQPFVNQQYIDARRQYHIERKKHSKILNRVGNFTGVTLLILLALATVSGFVFFVPSLNKLYNESFTFSTGFYVFYSLFSIGLPFFILSKMLGKTPVKPAIAYEKPGNPGKACLLVFIGFAGCLLANYVTTFLRIFAEMIGIYSDYSAIEHPETVFDAVLMFVATAIIPPLVEEYAFRGVLLSALKKYGNAFAIITTALLFGIFHGNAVQMPFAILCGLFLGYAVISSGSIWVGVIIHALMNSVSCVSSVLMSFVSDDAANTFYSAVMVGGICLGVLCFILYMARFKKENILNDRGIGTELQTSTKVGNFFGTPAMVIAIIIFVIQAIQGLSTTPTAY